MVNTRAKMSLAGIMLLFAGCAHSPQQKVSSVVKPNSTRTFVEADLIDLAWQSVKREYGWTDAGELDEHMFYFANQHGKRYLVAEPILRLGGNFRKYKKSAGSQFEVSELKRAWDSMPTSAGARSATSFAGDAWREHSKRTPKDRLVIENYRFVISERNEIAQVKFEDVIIESCLRYPDYPGFKKATMHFSKRTGNLLAYDFQPIDENFADEAGPKIGRMLPVDLVPHAWKMHTARPGFEAATLTYCQVKIDEEPDAYLVRFEAFAPKFESRSPSGVYRFSKSWMKRQPAPDLRKPWRTEADAFSAAWRLQAISCDPSQRNIQNYGMRSRGYDLCFGHRVLKENVRGSNFDENVADLSVSLDPKTAASWGYSCFSEFSFSAVRTVYDGRFSK